MHARPTGQAPKHGRSRSTTSSGFRNQIGVIRASAKPARYAWTMLIELSRCPRIGSSPLLRERPLRTRVSGTVAHQGATLECGVLGAAAGHALTPHPEGSRLHLAAHQGDHGGLVQAKLKLNGLERSAVLPSHLNDAGKIGWGLWCHHGGHGLTRGCARFKNDHGESRRPGNFDVSTGHFQSF